MVNPESSFEQTEHPMLRHRPFGSGEEDVLRILPYMGMMAILVM